MRSRETPIERALYYLFSGAVLALLIWAVKARNNRIECIMKQLPECTDKKSQHSGE